jgi:hypothetical protein
LQKIIPELDAGNIVGYLLLLSSMYTPAGKWDLGATIQHQRVERGVKNWRANLNCRDNTGVPDEQTLLL